MEQKDRQGQLLEQELTANPDGTMRQNYICKYEGNRSVWKDAYYD